MSGDGEVKGGEGESMYFRLICWIICMDLALQEWGYRRWYNLPLPKWVRRRLWVWNWMHPIRRIKHLWMGHQLCKLDPFMRDLRDKHRERMKEEKDAN